jgi:hypothetical protein
MTRLKKLSTYLSKNMYPETMKILGKVSDGHDPKLWLQIEETTSSQMRKHGVYLSIIMRDGEIVAIYIGSAAGEEGIASRWVDYEGMNIKSRLYNHSPWT